MSPALVVGATYVTKQNHLVCITAIKGKKVQLEYVGISTVTEVSSVTLQRWIDNGVLTERAGPQSAPATGQIAPTKGT